MFSGQRSTDGQGSAFMDAGEHQGWDGASEETARTFLGDPDDPDLEDWYDKQLAVLYDHHDRMVYNMMGWLAVGCHHLAEEAWQANDLERAQYEGMWIHETQPPNSQLYSQEDSQQCGKPVSSHACVLVRSLQRQPDSPLSPPFASIADGVRQFLRYGGPQAEVEDDVEQMVVFTFAFSASPSLSLVHLCFLCVIFACTADATCCY
jgi:hypothetical protein